jgi:allantoate deiminase
MHVSPSIAARRTDQRFTSAARQVMARCDELATFSESEHGLQRTFCSPAMANAHGRLRTWLAHAGLAYRLDQSTNLIASYCINRAESPQALLIGSHLDTVPGAGKYDGVLGVLLGLGLLELLAAEHVELPFAIDLIAFCEEEGIRFATPFLGSLAASGQFEEGLLDCLDENGTTMREAIARFGGDPEHISACAYDPTRVLGYVEAHIEQGPVLDGANLPLGVVSAIAGQTRAALRFTGQAGQAGTVPIVARRDALVAAAQLIVEVERIATEDEELFATVGRIDVLPNIANVIPGEVELRLDVRHPDDATRKSAAEWIIARAVEVAHRRNLEFRIDWVQECSSIQAHAHLSGVLASSIADCGVDVRNLPSGAGHDAAVMAARFPMAMMFVRCAGGVSHHPDESVREDDVALALEALWHFVHRLRDSISPTATPSFN